VGQWFELTNLSAVSVDLNGWKIGEDHWINGEDLVIPPGEYFVVGSNADMATNGGIRLDYVYGGLSLSDVVDDIQLFSPSGGLVDGVSYDYTWPDPGCASLQLSATRFDISMNNFASSWCASPEQGTDGDPGSPGRPNAVCPEADVCGDGDAGPSADCGDGEDN
jgi:hypothetical protein